MLVKESLESQQPTPKVLLIEEHSEALELLADFFKRRGVLPVLADSFSAALMSVDQHAGDWCGLVVTWDSQDPECEFKLQMLRSKATFHRTLALVRAERELTKMSSLFRLGLVDYFEIKPEDPEEIVKFLIGGYVDAP